MAKLLAGAEVAGALDRKTQALAASLSASGTIPTLAIVRVGEKAADLSYEAGARRRCEALGITLQSRALPEDVTQQSLLDTLHALAGDRAVHGILLLCPLPPTLDEASARAAIPAAKDVDGVTGASLAGVYAGTGEGFAPCTAQAVLEILDHYGIDCEGKRAAVLGRSLTVGRPAAMLLMQRGATVTICHSRTGDVPAAARQAELLVAAIGKARAVGAECFAPGQIVIDVGIHRDADGKLCGDVDLAAAQDIVEAVTPVPGGVGAVTTSVLLYHVTQAAAASCRPAAESV